MITKKTVLILGAGASYAYGFPLGEGLKNSILSRLTDVTIDTIASGGGFKTRDARTFREAFKGCLGAGTIDAFLRDRREFIEFGRYMIAVALLHCENNKNMTPKENWYRNLYGVLNENGFDAFGDNKLSIITFNYDRSLEHFLYESLIHGHGYDQSDIACADQLNKIPIIHVHGQLGYLPWQLEDSNYDPGNPQYQDPDWDLNVVKFGGSSSSATKNDFDLAAKSIKIVHEVSKEDDPFVKANALLQKARCIYILGLGYHPENLERLGLKQLPQGKDLRGTAYKLGMSGREIANDHMCKSMYRHQVGEELLSYNKLINKTVYNFLHDHVHFQ